MNAVHTLNLPTSLGTHQIRNVLRSVQFFPENPASLELRFHPQKQHLDPLGIAMLAAWGDHWQRRNVPIKCVHLKGSTAVYAQRVGLLSHLGAVSGPIHEHEEAGRFVEVTRVDTQQSLTALCANIGGVLKAPHLTEMVQYVLSEIARNSLEHAHSPAFVSAQYYAKDKRVSIGIADCGIGVRESLRSNYPFDSDERALVGALTPGISGATRDPYSAPDNAGLGLYFARGIAKASGREFVIASGTALYRQKPKQDTQLPSHDPVAERHELIGKCSSWNGTLVGVNVRGVDKTLLAKLGRALNIGAGVAPNPRIRFT